MMLSASASGSSVVTSGSHGLASPSRARETLANSTCKREPERKIENHADDRGGDGGERALTASGMRRKRSI